ncbi:MAG: bifunctional 3-deoxy-7-phosphoheptulonate synthase/chorismate mutase type II [Bacteroidales bacterium]|nr:bifunctional 3-deoxy-7-phosphoheptulonate synthase/chorismate mutase type II [Bacteroidales bacterium]
MQLFNYFIAGPCAAESEEQVYETARQLYEHSKGFPIPLSFFRAGVWKPRSSANSFCGVGEVAFPWLQRVEKDFHFPICVEVANTQHIEICQKYNIRHIWIGARTAVNPFIIQDLADATHNGNFTVMVKNPVIPDLKLWIGNIERFEKAGAAQVLAVHRGFAEQKENVLRNAPLWEIPIELRIQRPDIPIICDPSHIAGNTTYIKQISQIAIDYGFNGLMIETHCSPTKALSDQQQQLTPDELQTLLSQLIFKQNNLPDNLLRKQRTLIRNIDAQISQLLSKRMELVEEIAKIKKERQMPLIQPEQWNQVVNNYQQYAHHDPCFDEFLQKYLSLLHQYSLLKQQEINHENNH